MKKFFYGNKSDDYIRTRYVKCLNYINSLNETLKYLPSQSILCRMSIDWTIKKEELRLESLKQEINKRNMNINNS